MEKIFARALIMICVFLAVCSISAAIGQDSAKKILRVNGAGMASDQVEKWAKQFNAKTPNVSVTVIVSSAQRGFLSLLDGTAEIAIMSREIMPDERKKAAEKGLQIAESPVGHAAITLITHPRNPVNELTLDQLRKLYTGEYDNWKSVGGPDEPVTCLSCRVPESGGGRILPGKSPRKGYLLELRPCSWTDGTPSLRSALRVNIYQSVSSHIRGTPAGSRCCG